LVQRALDLFHLLHVFGFGGFARTGAFVVQTRLFDSEAPCTFGWNRGFHAPSVDVVSIPAKRPQGGIDARDEFGVGLAAILGSFAAAQRDELHRRLGVAHRLLHSGCRGAQFPKTIAQPRAELVMEREHPIVAFARKPGLDGV